MVRCEAISTPFPLLLFHIPGESRSERMDTYLIHSRQSSRVPVPTPDNTLRTSFYRKVLTPHLPCLDAGRRDTTCPHPMLDDHDDLFC